MTPRVLFVVDTIDQLGPGSFFRETADLLARRGLKFEVAVLDVKHAWIESSSQAPAFAIHFLGHRFPIDIGMTIQLRRLAKRLGANVVHAISEHGLKIARMATASSNLHLLGCKFDFKNCGSLNWLGSRVLSSGSIQLLVSHPAIGARLKQAGVSLPIREFQLGAPLPRFDDVQGRSSIDIEIRERFQIPQDYFLIGADAVHLPETRFKDLLWAVDLVQCVRSDFRLMVFGHGPQSGRLRKFAEQCKAIDKTIFVDRFSNCLEWLPEFDLFWHAYAFNPSPYPVLSALRAGCPVLAPRCEGLEDLIEPNVNGMLFDVGQRDQIARLTHALFNDPVRLEQLKQNASQTPHLCDLGTMADEWLQIYNETINSDGQQQGAWSDVAN